MTSLQRTVRLARSDFQYLSMAGFLSPALLECLQRIDWISESTGMLAVSSEMAEEFREALTIRLAKVGFDRVYEPTAEGRILEQLIDRFHQ